MLDGSPRKQGFAPKNYTLWMTAASHCRCTCLIDLCSLHHVTESHLFCFQYAAFTWSQGVVEANIFYYSSIYSTTCHIGLEIHCAALSFAMW